MITNVHPNNISHMPVFLFEQEENTNFYSLTFSQTSPDSSDSTIESGMNNTIIVPSSIFTNSYFYQHEIVEGNGNESWPNLTFYGDNSSADSTTAHVSGVIYGNISGDDLESLLTELSKNTTGTISYDYTTDDPYQINLPSDVLKLVPFSQYASGSKGVNPDLRVLIENSPTQALKGASAKGVHNSVNGWGDFLKGIVNAAVEVGTVAWDFAVMAAQSAKNIVCSAITAIATTAEEFLTQLGKAIIDFGKKTIGTLKEKMSEIKENMEAGVSYLQGIGRSILRESILIMTAAMNRVIDDIHRKIEESTESHINRKIQESTKTSSLKTKNLLINTLQYLYININSDDTRSTERTAALFLSSLLLMKNTGIYSPITPLLASMYSITYIYMDKNFMGDVMVPSIKNVREKIGKILNENPQVFTLSYTEINPMSSYFSVSDRYLSTQISSTERNFNPSDYGISVSDIPTTDIIYPSFGDPAILEKSASGEWTLKLSVKSYDSSISSWDVKISASESMTFSKEVSCTVTSEDYSYSNHMWNLEVEIPADALPQGYERAMYDISVKGDEHDFGTQFHSVEVLSSLRSIPYIIQLTDLHIGERYAERNLIQLVDKINSKMPDFVVITGDIVNGGPLENLKLVAGNGEDEYYSSTADEYKVARAILSRLKVPVYTTPGNHDYIESEKAGVDDVILGAIELLFGIQAASCTSATYLFDASIEGFLQSVPAYRLYEDLGGTGIGGLLQPVIDTELKTTETLLISGVAHITSSVRYGIDDYEHYMVPDMRSKTTSTHPADYSFDYGQYHFISVDSGKPDNFLDVNLPGLDSDQLYWMKYTDYPDAVQRGSTHTFIFTHAPIVNGTIKIGISMDATHVSPNDYRFVYWITKTKPTPNIEAIFVGHTHANVADFLKGVKSGEANDRNIDWSGSDHTTGTFYYSNYPVCFQEYKSTG